MRKCFIIMLILLMGVLTGCAKVNIEEFQAVDKILRENLPMNVESDLDLAAVASKVTGANITWESDNEGILTKDGKYKAPLEETVTLTAIIKIKNTVQRYSYTLYTPKSYERDMSRAWDFFRGRIKSLAGTNLNLAYEYLEKCLATYESSNQNALTNEGVIAKKADEQVVTLTTKINCGGIMRNYESEVVVASFSDGERVIKIKEWLPSQLEAYLNGTIDKLPITHPEVGGKINYYSPMIGVIKADGTIIRPVDVVTTSITAEISYGKDSSKLEFNLNNFGGSTEKEFLDEWLSQQMPEFFLGSKTTFNPIKDGNGTTIDYSFANQVRTNDYGVVNLFTGQDPEIVHDLITGTDLKNLTNWNEATNTPLARPVIPQEYLDRDMYPGYQMPNDDNILWVVIHESGMPSNGNTATLLANLMRQKINNPNNSSSWHYSVDENKIIQSLPHEVRGWHAGGQGTTKYYGYNTNSIGIEMAINGDGNYEGAMRNDAKLVAYLLDQYNLTIANVKRHYDSFGKICPIIMINTNRYYEFLDYVSTELTARKYLKDAIVTWEISDPSLLVKLGNGIYANKPQAEDKTVNFKLTVSKADYYFEKTFTVKINKSN